MVKSSTNHTHKTKYTNLVLRSCRYKIIVENVEIMIISSHKVVVVKSSINQIINNNNNNNNAPKT